MGKKAKIGKQRKDRFYKLAKETGFRSRASFKLIQLNRKFEFLQTSRVVIDLCAAPGGWLQVVQQTTPVSSVIIGVDLVSIKPLPNVITLQEDITTERCRQSLKKQLKTWKADTVLHDGAPNVGQNWIQDAFSQNQLTLSAFKLATEMLMKGGWFITKIFRSKDYLSLIWVFKKLFKKVTVTKPQASRNESAEIFVVCQGYLAPDRIDPKFLDPAHVFKEVEGKSETKANILQITKNKRKAVGYEGDSSVYNQVKVTDFIFGENYLEVLSNCTELVFDDEDIRDHKLTTKELKQCCADIRVLGKGDIRLLLKWRKELNHAIKGAEEKETTRDLATVELQGDDKDLDDALKEAENLELEKLQEAKRKKKKILKQRQKFHERVNLKMIIKDNDPIIDEDRELFNISRIRDKKDLEKVEDETDLEFSFDPAQPDIMEEMLQGGGFRNSYIPYDRYDNDNSYIEAETTKESEYSDSDEDMEQEMEFESDEDNDDEINEETQNVVEGKHNPLVIDLVERTERVKDTVARWFDKDDFANISDDNDLELDLIAENMEKSRKTGRGKEKIKDNETEVFPENIPDEENDDTCEKPKADPAENAGDNRLGKKKKKRVRLDPEGLALGSMMVQSKKMKRDIIESAYNRYASNDENLPDWFTKDEELHNRKQLPVSAELVSIYKERLREINARPIKKVVEAKARKKRRAARRMEKARKRAEVITESLDLGETEKREQLRTVYKKAMQKKDTSVTYVVAKKGIGKRVRRPAGVKGRFKVVDKRMRKDDRKLKNQQKSEKKQKFNKNKKKKKN